MSSFWGIIIEDQHSLWIIIYKDLYSVCADTGISTQADDASEYEGEGTSRMDQHDKTENEKKEQDKKTPVKKKKKKKK